LIAKSRKRIKIKDIEKIKKLHFYEKNGAPDNNFQFFGFFFSNHPIFRLPALK